MATLAIVAASPALADPKVVKLVPQLPNIDDTPTRMYGAFVDTMLPASEPFVIEMKPPATAMDAAVLVLWPDDTECGPEGQGPHCPQHYELAMTSSGSGSDRVLRAQVPALQVDQRYNFRVRLAGPLEDSVVNRASDDVARRLVAHLNNLALPACQQNGAFGSPACSYSVEALTAVISETLLASLTANLQPLAPDATPASTVPRNAITRHGEPNKALLDYIAKQIALDLRNPPTTSTSTSADEKKTDSTKPETKTDTSKAPAATDSASRAKEAAKLLGDFAKWLDEHATPVTPTPAATPSAPAKTEAAASAPAPSGPDLGDYVSEAIVRVRTAAKLKTAQDEISRADAELVQALGRVGPPREAYVLVPSQPATALPQVLTLKDPPAATLETIATELDALAQEPGADPNYKKWADGIRAFSTTTDPKERDALVKSLRASVPRPQDYLFATGGGIRTLRSLLEPQAVPRGEATVVIAQPADVVAGFTAATRFTTPEAVIAAKLADHEAKVVSAFSAMLATLSALDTKFGDDAKALYARIIAVTRAQLGNQRAAAAGTVVTASAGYGVTPVAGNYAVPDFGVAFAMPWVDTKAQDLWMVPYVGLTIYFTSVDRKIAFDQLAGTWWHRHVAMRTSFTAALTLTSPGLAGYSVSGPLENRFPLAAVGYRISHFVRLTAGAMFYRVSSMNPTSSTTSLAAAPFFGISVDADFIEIARSGFSKF